MTATTGSAELLACPLCNSASEASTAFDGSVYEGHVVICTNGKCGCQSGIFPTPAMALKAWNTRLAAKPAEEVREAHIAKASALARKLCQLFDSGGESQRTVRARHASAIFQLLGSNETEQRQCDADPVCYLERCERLALSTPGQPKP